ncbi:hypothetical protein LSG31_18995 [Fodinisporobacter ferrooxydans]|uniref:DUF4825 domain-containing protein n=1 Tax=Fodinisporobacter ferrooxydans TaxID=2901836 RepID=A0ABY4CL03_9BACL|nr:hypothetical protein LSG31_18995 [Alicyclobacillaceae bacterium MYW30-H2]
MYLKQIRTYILLAVVLLVYGYFLYLPFRSESMNDIIVDYSRAVGNLHVDEPLYGTELNDVLSQNLKLRGIFYHRFRDANETADQLAYWNAESMTHRIQLELLILSLNHDLYQQTDGVAQEKPSYADYQQIATLIQNLSDTNISKADELQKRAFQLMKTTGLPNLGGIYILAHDLVLLMQMNDPINKQFCQIDLNLLREKAKSFEGPMQGPQMIGKGMIRDSFIDAEVDDAISTVQMASRMSKKADTDPMQSIALESYTIPSIPASNGQSYVKMVGIDNGVAYRALVGSVFNWDVPNGKYNVEIHRDQDFVWAKTLPLADDMQIEANLVRSDQTLLTVFKPSIMESIQQIGYNLLDFIHQSNEPQAGLTYMSFEQVVEQLPTGTETNVADQYKKDIQPEQVITELRQMNDQLYNIVYHHGSSNNQWKQMIAAAFPRSQITEVASLWPPGKLTEPIKLDYIFIDVKAFRMTPTPALYVTFAWFTPDMQREAWNVTFSTVHGRFVVAGVNKDVDPHVFSRFGTFFSYKTKNHLEYLQTVPSGSPADLKQTCRELLPGAAGESLFPGQAHNLTK